MAGVMRLARIGYAMYVSKNEIRVACADTASADPLFAFPLSTCIGDVLGRFHIYRRRRSKLRSLCVASGLPPRRSPAAPTTLLMGMGIPMCRPSSRYWPGGTQGCIARAATQRLGPQPRTGLKQTCLRLPRSRPPRRQGISKRRQPCRSGSSRTCQSRTTACTRPYIKL